MENVNMYLKSSEMYRFGKTKSHTQIEERTVGSGNEENATDWVIF